MQKLTIYGNYIWVLGLYYALQSGKTGNSWGWTRVMCYVNRWS